MQLTDVDLTNLDTFRNGVPEDQLALLRREDPVHWHSEAAGPGFWAVTRHPDVVKVNQDNVTFSSARRSALMVELPEAELEQQRLMMLNMDPPMHTRYRLLVNKGFTPRTVARLEDRIREMTGEIIDSVIDKHECDFVTDVAAELPLQVITELMGVPLEDRHLVFDWSNRMIGQDDPEYQATPEAATLAAMELYAYCDQLAADKRIHPHDDLMSVLINVEVEGEHLSDFELDMFFLLLCVAGNETTRNLISHGLHALIEHPDEKAKLVARPDLIPGAVEEMLRWATPVMHFRRTATKATDIGGHPIAEGDKVVIWYSSANRDEAVFDDPYTFDVTRRPNPHVAFGGGGPHFCLGANLARMEIRVVFEELMRRIPDMALNGPVERLRSNFINGIKHMPVVWR
ncbi:MAG TPA: cytochrome P450 [Acidimicrobiales bacterium]|nr:cytochrome P450 [Acidimicrobiales bacterium]